MKQKALKSEVRALLIVVYKPRSAQRLLLETECLFRKWWKRLEGSLGIELNRKFE